MAPYTFESSHTTIDHLNKHFPAIYIVSQQHILRDLYRGYNSFWFILCEQIFSDTIAKGVVADRNVGGNVGKWVQTSWGDGRINPSRSRGQAKKKGGRGTYPFFKKCFCPPTLLCKDLEKAEFVAFSQIFSRNQGVIKGVWSRKTFCLLFSFESFKAYPSTLPSPHEVCTHFPTFPPTFRSATTPLAIVSENGRVEG
jgi:hypothetical protein